MLINCSDAIADLPQNTHNLSSFEYVRIDNILFLLTFNWTIHPTMLMKMRSHYFHLPNEPWEELWTHLNLVLGVWANLKEHSNDAVERSSRPVDNMGQLENRYFGQKFGGLQIHQ